MGSPVSAKGGEKTGVLISQCTGRVLTISIDSLAEELEDGILVVLLDLRPAVLCELVKKGIMMDLGVGSLPRSCGKGGIQHMDGSFTIHYGLVRVGCKKTEIINYEFGSGSRLAASCSFLCSINNVQRLAKCGVSWRLERHLRLLVDGLGSPGTLPFCDFLVNVFPANASTHRPNLQDYWLLVRAGNGVFPREAALEWHA